MTQGLTCSHGSDVNCLRTLELTLAHLQQLTAKCRWEFLKILLYTYIQQQLFTYLFSFFVMFQSFFAFAFLLIRAKYSHCKFPCCKTHK